MLNISLKSTYTDSDRFSWEYYQDDTDPSTYYILPRPQFVTTNGRPSFQIITATTDSPATNGAGYCRFDVSLAVPASIETAIGAQIKQRSPGANPVFAAVNEQPGGQATITLSDGSKTITAVAPVSGFGSDVASFVLHLTADQVQTLRAAFSTSGGAAEVEYHIKVPARLPAVKAVMSFDSAIAYSYQVTRPSYNEWGDETSPGSVKKMLDESSSSKVTLNWGTASPSADLQQAVATWANDTLADEVQAEVLKTVQLQGLTNANSFSINEVSSFTSEYDSNEVIDWILVPTQTLPSFPDMGLQLADFESDVNEQQQVMQVCTQLLFAGQDQAGQNDPVPVTKLTATVSYPGLSQADATCEFTGNGSHMFVAPYDVQHGPSWDLQYTATYAGSTAPVTGTIKGIELAAYTLTLPDVGILSVGFDASSAFSAPAPDRIDVVVTYPDFDGHGTPFNQTLKLTSATRQGTISSVGALPVDSYYNWQATYVYADNTTVTGPLNRGASGTTQIIPAAGGVKQTKIIVLVPPQNEQLIEADVNVYYQGQPQPIPGAATQYPTRQSPAVFSLVPQPAGQQSLAVDTFYGLVNGNQPLVYSATITLVSGNQVVIDDQLVQNNQPSVLVSPTARYYTVEVSPTAIDWDTATFESVSVTLTQDGKAPQSPFTWNKGETDPWYVTWEVPAPGTASYSWFATYTIKGQGSVSTAPVTGVIEPLLTLPATPPSGAKVQAFVPRPMRAADLLPR